ncbi:MAG: branched-chain amino acid ABC transporter permease, partial [Chloroflexi bacterium]|nr:branched-chain amino acid ABC transporter permease [Chloroflexota bacterium]
MICEATECAALLLQIAIFGLSNGAVIALNAIGFTLVYGAVRQINFAHGDLYALTSVFT